MKALLSLLLLSALAAAVTPLQAEANQCSNATVAGRWGYSYTGTIFTQNGSIACRVRRPLSPGRTATSAEARRQRWLDKLESRKSLEPSLLIGTAQPREISMCLLMDH